MRAYSRDDDRQTTCRVRTLRATKHNDMLRHATPRRSTPRRTTPCRAAAPRKVTLVLAAQRQATARLAKPRHARTWAANTK